MKKLIIPMLLSLSFSAFANLSLPQISAPDELVRGDFAEGTITQISSAEIAEFLPWAQNAKNQLTRALNTARTLPLRDRRTHIERSIRSVVNRSGDRQYQMFMRFSLNRGLLLVSEMSKTMDMTAIGAQESALDILQRSIEVALNFYESDLSFQQRAQSGDASTELSYARFAINFKNSLYAGVINVLDAKAQYRLLYKLVEMVNWDLSRDSHASKHAEEIVEAYEMQQDLLPEPADDDRLNLRYIRRLNTLRLLSLSHDGSRLGGQAQPQIPGVRYGTPSERVTGADIRVGSVVVETHGTISIQRVKNIAGDGFLLLDDGQWYHPTYIKRLVTSYDGISLDQEVYESHGTATIDKVLYITADGLYFLNSADSWFHYSYVEALVDTFNNFRIGEQVVETHGNRSIRTIQRITSKGIFLLDDGTFYHHAYIVKLQ